MPYVIRPYSDGDAEALAAICQASIMGIGPAAYEARQIAAWAARHPSAEKYRARVRGGAVIFVAEAPGGGPVAYALLEPDGHLDHLYNHPEHTRQGLASQLLLAAENHAKSEGLTRLYTEASELARAAFERVGYTLLHRRDFDIDGVPIHNYAMEKRLD